MGIEEDVSSLADLDKLFSAVKDKKGQLDVLFPNAGIIRYVPLIEISPEHFYNLFEEIYLQYKKHLQFFKMVALSF